MKVDAACIGNHELDFGIDQMSHVLAQTMIPNGSCRWIMSNLVIKGTEDGLTGIAKTAVIKRGPIQIGLIGIAEQEWLETF